MRGALLMTFISKDGVGGDNYQVYVNGELRDLNYTSNTNLYSTYLELGDIVNIVISGDTNIAETLNIIRTDYTTDNENNDNGIKSTSINSISNYLPITVTFTASTRNDSYKYYYEIDSSETDCYYIGTGFNSNAEVINLFSNDKSIITGQYTSYSGLSRNRIIKLNSNGVVDYNFNIGTGFNNNTFSNATQSDDKILVGGLFTTYSGISVSSLIRLNNDGSLDNSFQLSGYTPAITAAPIFIKIQTDSKILFGTVTRLRRCNSSGLKDSTFTEGVVSVGSIINAIELQSDNKILVGGGYTSYNGTSKNRIVRINSDGSIDNTFNIGTGFNDSVFKIKIQSNGKILVGGRFTSYNGSARNNIIRLNSDGTIDSTFSIGTGFGGSFGYIVSAIELQSDGKIVVGGSFSTYQGQSYNGIIRLNSNGSIDTSFVVGTGLSGGAQDMKIDSDGKIIVVGGFTSYNGTTANEIIRLNSDGSENLCP